MKLTFVWQNHTTWERTWIEKIFAPIAGEQVIDGEHRVVLDNCLMIDSYLHSQPREYYAQFRGKNAWLLHLSDETYEGGYDCYDNFRGVFRNYWAGIFNPRRVIHFPLGYTTGFTASANTLEASQRPYLWSFLGQANKSSRPEMIQALLPLQPHFAHITDQGDTQPIGKQQYQRIQCDSIFVPCSMGNVNMESFRVFESLENGCIPILEKRPTLDYFAHLLGPHPLPIFSSWKSAAQFIAANRDDSAALNKLQAECVAWWSNHKSAISQRIQDFLATAPGSEAGPYLSWRYRLPGWQPVELMRHGTVRSLARRVNLQIQRLVKQGKLRETKGA
jgi:hypothetical protein